MEDILKRNYVDEVSKFRVQNRKLMGKRIRCDKMNDPYPVPSGTEGTISHVDDVGTIHVIWDNGSMLGLVPNEDSYTILDS